MRARELDAGVGEERPVAGSYRRSAIGVVTKPSSPAPELPSKKQSALWVALSPGMPSRRALVVSSGPVNSGSSRHQASSSSSTPCCRRSCHRTARPRASRRVVDGAARRGRAAGRQAVPSPPTIRLSPRAQRATVMMVARVVASPPSVEDHMPCQRRANQASTRKKIHHGIGSGRDLSVDPAEFL